MIPLQDAVTDTHSLLYHFRTLFHSVEQYFRIELFLLIFMEVLALIVIPKCRSVKWYLDICIAFNLLLSCGYILYRFLPGNLSNWVAAYIAILLINLSFDSILVSAKNKLKD